jgi:lipopolysaccharide transport system ATP-binding protein
MRDRPCKSKIAVENLGKRYFVGHQNRERERYTALRDVVSRNVRDLVRKTRDVLRGRQIVQGDEVEEFWALRNVSFEVKQGEVLGIIGRNGAGKSTLLKVLSRITEPTEGCVTLGGRLASLLEVGTGFHSELSGRENIFLNGAILGMTRSEVRRKYDEIVEFAEVEKFLDTPVKRYSSGMYVRLAFAVAAHLEPEILVVDEVLAVGDAEFQKRCLGKMHDVATREGRTVLFVSHNMSAIRNLCARCILLSDGRIVADGPSDSTIAQYSEMGTGKAGVTWSRPREKCISQMGFERICGRVDGKQPTMRLVCDITLRSVSHTAPVLIAVDICDRASTPIMQALPSVRPFVPGTVGVRQLSLEVDLPPLVPGWYTADFWIGAHFSSTMDQIPGAIAFEIRESPSPDRNFPHTSEHGFMVPASRCRVAEM